jgi:hypothetical protein
MDIGRDGAVCEAFPMFDETMKDYKSMIGEELYSSTRLQIMIQVALQGIRHDVHSDGMFEQFQERFFLCLCVCLPSPSSLFLIHTLASG